MDFAALCPDPTRWQRIRSAPTLHDMIAPATAARLAGDWRAAAAAARTDVDIDLEEVGARFGAAAAATVEEDLRHLALDLLWWHLPRHHGGRATLRPRASAILMPRPGRISGPLIRVRLPLSPTGPQRLRMSVVSIDDLDGPQAFFTPGYTWDVRAASGLRAAWGGSADRPPLLRADGTPVTAAELGSGGDRAAGTERIYRLLADGDDIRAWADSGIAIDIGAPSEVPWRKKLWPPPCPVGLADEARSVAAALGTDTAATAFAGYVWLRLGGDIRASLSSHGEFLETGAKLALSGVPADLILLATGRQRPDDLHPLMHASLFPELPAPASRRPATTSPAAPPVRVRCGGGWHEIGVSGGSLRLDHHDEAEIQRERVIRSLGGTSTGCFAARDGWLAGATRLPRLLARQRREVFGHVQAGDTDWLVEGLIGGTIDPHVRDGLGWTLMHVVMCVEHERVLPLLCAAGLAIDERDRVGRTPLYVATMNGAAPDLIRWFVDAGADPNAQTEHGSSPARVAARRARNPEVGFLSELRRHAPAS